MDPKPCVCRALLPITISRSFAALDCFFDGFGPVPRPFPFRLCLRAIAAAAAGPSAPLLHLSALGMPGAERVPPVLARSQVPIENVLSLHDVREVYTVPEMLEKQARAPPPPPP